MVFSLIAQSVSVIAKNLPARAPLSHLLRAGFSTSAAVQKAPNWYLIEGGFGSTVFHTFAQTGDTENMLKYLDRLRELPVAEQIAILKMGNSTVGTAEDVARRYSKNLNGGSAVLEPVAVALIEHLKDLKKAHLAEEALKANSPNVYTFSSIQGKLQQAANGEATTFESACAIKPPCLKK
jgi:hypothetical protein